MPFKDSELVLVLVILTFNLKAKNKTGRSHRYIDRYIVQNLAKRLNIFEFNNSFSSVNSEDIYSHFISPTGSVQDNC